MTPRLHVNRPMIVATAWMSLAGLSIALAQPPAPPDGGPPPEYRDPIRRVLDANRDFELDADEIAKAPEMLAKLDENGDGKLDRAEFRPPLGPPPGGPGRGPGDRGVEGRPRRPGDFGGRPPREGGGPPPPRDSESAAGPRPPREGFRPGGGPPGDRPSPERFLERAMSFDADGDGRLDASELEALAAAMAERGRARGPGGPAGPPRDGDERPRRPE